VSNGGQTSLGGFRTLLAAHAGDAAPTTRARIDRGPMGKGGSQARRWECYDRLTYAVKHSNNPQITGGATHLLATEFVAARVGAAMGVPVFPVILVEVAPELVAGVKYEGTDIELAPGRAFGSFIRPDADLVDTDTAPPQWKQAAANRNRAASVCVFHAVLKLGDAPQFVVRTGEPYEFWSIDHGHFISGGGPWTAALTTEPDMTDVPTNHFPDLNLTADELRAAAQPAARLSDEQLAALVAPMPGEWCPSADLRARCVQFIARRRDKIAELLGIDSEEEPA
jgi:hypothetical protein